MKKHRLKKQFLEEIQINPNVSLGCAKLNISRQTAYRWMDEDYDFRMEYEKYRNQGKDSIYDLAHSKLVSAVNDGKRWAIENIIRRYDPDTRGGKKENCQLIAPAIIFQDYDEYENIENKPV